MKYMRLLQKLWVLAVKPFWDPPGCLIENQIWSSDVGPLGDLTDGGICDLDQWDPLSNLLKYSQA